MVVSTSFNPNTFFIYSQFIHLKDQQRRKQRLQEFHGRDMTFILNIKMFIKQLKESFVINEIVLNIMFSDRDFFSLLTYVKERESYANSMYQIILF